MTKYPLLLSAVLLYALLSLASLTFFPFMHSDEGWLASLSRSILTERNIGATEDFFHETDRNPHAIKSLFHLIQIPFTAARFTLFSVRLLSLIAGLITLYFLYLASLHIFHDRLFAVIVTGLTALDIQFIYATHFARQEIIILMILSICLCLFYKQFNIWSCKKDIIIGGLLGISIGIHPNIFIIATGITFLYIFYSTAGTITKNKKYPSFLNTGLFILTLGFFGIIYIGFSLILDPEFISNYMNFGSDHGVTSPFIIKLLKLPRFYKKMFFQISGTYYLPDIRLQLLMFITSFLVLIPLTFVVKKNRITILSLQILMLGINTGILIIGKYSPPSTIFIFIPGYLLTFTLIKVLFSSPINFVRVSLILTVLTAGISAVQIFPWNTINYNSYIQKIRNHIPDGSKTLANLNSIFAFPPKTLHTYRDLPALDPSHNFKGYINKYKIEYIVYYDELEIVFNERPVWNTMYGNIYPWYEDMTVFLQDNCEQISKWNEPVFGMRIGSYMGKRGGDVTVYRVMGTEKD